VLREDGTLIPTTHFELAREAGEDAAEKSKEYVRRHWKYREPEMINVQTGDPPSMDSFLERIQSYSLCISGMAFQDAWNIDLKRLQRCCIHVIAAENKLIPFCIYYLTDSSGRRFLDRNLFK
jgi:7,8-dihydro-6-hydroxymethylpterin dimethyltransferase